MIGTSAIRHKKVLLLSPAAAAAARRANRAIQHGVSMLKILRRKAFIIWIS
jgi:hypothetical protein